MRQLAFLLLTVAFAACSDASRDTAGADAAAAADTLYGGRVFGIYQPLEVTETSAMIAIEGETFRYTIDKASGQVFSAKALGTEFLADGASFPNPYAGLMPPNDPGATRTGGAERERYSFEKAMEMRPVLFSGKLTGAWRYDADESVDVTTRLVESTESRVVVHAQGTYANGDGGPSPSPLAWSVEYECDVDGFLKVTVGLASSEPVKLRWHCFAHTTFEPSAVDFLSRYEEPGSPPFGMRPAPTVGLNDAAVGDPVLESHWTPVVHLGNPLTGIEFTKEYLGGLTGYRDSRVELEDGREIHTGSVETGNGEWLSGHDSRGRRGVLTQIFRRPDGFELEEFDIRNTTYALNPGESRSRTFYVQLTPPKLPRADWNSSRIVWPGPHQVQMVRWRGRTEEWAPPSNELLRQWAAAGVNLIVGGANYFSGDYSNPTHPEKIREFLDAAHGYGLKVIPYVTFSDWNFEAPGYQQHAADWMVSKSIEYAHHTTLMCFGAEGWREHVEREVNSLLAAFEFDGLYVDHWFHTRHCWNPRHGCDGYLGRFVTDGYHDFARRLRAAVARHTGGDGIMLLNSNNLISSTNLAWFDMRLLGENNDPLVAGDETLVSTWNGKRQGVQSAIMWRQDQDAIDMLNFAATFGFSLRLRKSWNNDNLLSDWRAADDRATELGMNRLYWDVLRGFGANRARMLTAFDSRDIISLGQPGSHVTAFARDGRLLLMMGYQAATDRAASAAGRRPVRRERLRLHNLDELGLDPDAAYRVVDLAAGAYLTRNPSTPADLDGLPVELTLGRARMLLVVPAADESPRLVYFRGADGVSVTRTGEEISFAIDAVQGAPVELYLDAGGTNIQSRSDGFAVSRHPAGDFTVVSGILRENNTIAVAVGR